MPEQVPSQNSILLTQEENQQVHKLLGNRCLSLATAVVQLFLTQPPHHLQYSKHSTGVLCFVKDNIKKNYFFRLHCLQRNSQIWEHEMYENMTYTEATQFLHVFEGEDSIVAFNFASPEEARFFKMQVTKKIDIKRRKAENRSHHTLRAPNNNNAYHTQNSEVKEISTNKRSGRKQKITKADIGIPMDFKHVTHVGWTQDSGFDVDTEDVQLRMFFDKAGVSEKHLRDRDTREFIYDFINKHGGRDAVAETNKNRAAPVGNAAPVPPVPPRGAAKPHSRAAPPPPPSRPSYKPEKVPPPPPTMGGFSPVEAVGASPPPPPPPPPMVETCDAPVSAMHSGLIEEIQGGACLKPVENRAPPPQNDPRSDLLTQIRGGFALKPVAERKIESKPPPAQEGKVDLASALARALADRKNAITNSEDDEDESNDDEEWE